MGEFVPEHKKRFFCLWEEELSRVQHTTREDFQKQPILEDLNGKFLDCGVPTTANVESPEGPFTLYKDCRVFYPPHRAF